MEAKIKRHPDVESSPINVTKYGDWICAEKKCNYGTHSVSISSVEYFDEKKFVKSLEASFLKGITVLRNENDLLILSSKKQECTYT